MTQNTPNLKIKLKSHNSQITVHTVHKKTQRAGQRANRLAEQYSKDKKNKNMNLRGERNFLDLPCVTVIKDLRRDSSSNSPDLI